MNYHQYKETRDSVWQLLLDMDIKELPIKITEVCRRLGIQVKLYAPQDGNSAECRMIMGNPLILVSENEPVHRQRFSAAHELGHIIRGDVGKYPLVNREQDPTDNPIEQAANVFASRLLAPACVLWGCNVQTQEQIVQLCDISQTAAKYRMNRMQELYARGRFLTSPLERAVFERFQEYIETHRF